MSNTFTEKFDDHTIDCILSTALRAISTIHNARMDVKQLTYLLNQTEMVPTKKHQAEMVKTRSECRAKILEALGNLGA